MAGYGLVLMELEYIIKHLNWKGAVYLIIITMNPEWITAWVIQMSCLYMKKFKVNYGLVHVMASTGISGILMDSRELCLQQIQGQILFTILLVITTGIYGVRPRRDWFVLTINLIRIWTTPGIILKSSSRLEISDLEKFQDSETGPFSLEQIPGQVRAILVCIPIA